MGDFFGNIREDLDKAAQQTAEIHDMMRAMYARFAQEHGVELFDPPAFSVLKYQKEIERLERAYNLHFNTLWNMVSKAKFALMKRFFETIATRVKHVYDIANRDVEAWLKAVMAPLETQVREHHLQLRRRLDSIKRIHRASDELEERISELEQQSEALTLQIKGLKAEIAAIDASSSSRSCRSRPTADGGAVRRAPRVAACAARCWGPRCLGGQPRVLDEQRFARLDDVRIDRDAVDRTDLDALRRVEMADALGAAASGRSRRSRRPARSRRSGTRARRRRS